MNWRSFKGRKAMISLGFFYVTVLPSAWNVFSECVDANDCSYAKMLFWTIFYSRTIQGVVLRLGGRSSFLVPHSLSSEPKVSSNNPPSMKNA